MGNGQGGQGDCHTQEGRKSNHKNRDLVPHQGTLIGHSVDCTEVLGTLVLNLKGGGRNGQRVGGPKAERGGAKSLPST